MDTEERGQEVNAKLLNDLWLTIRGFSVAGH